MLMALSCQVSFGGSPHTYTQNERDYDDAIKNKAAELIKKNDFNHIFTVMSGEQAINYNGAFFKCRNTDKGGKTITFYLKNSDAIDNLIRKNVDWQYSSKFKLEKEILKTIDIKFQNLQDCELK